MCGVCVCGLPFPYTTEKQEMLKSVFGAEGSYYEDLNNGDLESKELKSTYKKSPIAKYKKNKFGV